MITYLFWGLVGSVGVALVNSFIRANPFNFNWFQMILAVALPTMFITQAGFIKFYWSAGSFHGAWFIGSGLTAITGLLATWLVFGENIGIYHWVGIGMILAGIITLGGLK